MDMYLSASFPYHLTKEHMSCSKPHHKLLLAVMVFTCS
jgi:hypothetical protein